MTEQEARKAAEQHCVEHLDGECCEIAAHMWHAALEWARTQQEPVAEVLWFDPALRLLPEQAEKIIDGSIAFMGSAPIGTKLYTAPVAPTVPKGWKLVPEEPSDEMVDAACNVSNLYRVDFVRAYESAIAAAPEYKESK